MIIAGEVSGDMHAAETVAALKRTLPDIEVFGIGGEHMRAVGVETLHDVKEMAVMGFAEVLRRFGFFRRVFHEMLDVARTRQPDAVLLVDYPGFNLRFAARAHALGIKVIYYICPQVWAWDRSRIPKMARVVDRLITIFPFEAECFAGTGLQVDFAGHPLVDEARAVNLTLPSRLPWRGEPRVALLPGSRVHEVERLLPLMWEAAGRIESQYRKASFVIAAPSPQMAALALECIGSRPGGPSRWEVVVGQTRQVLRQARAALVASGTATIEAALMRCPMVVAYRTSALTFLLARLLVRLDHIAMVNIVAGKRACPEFVQGDATGEHLADALAPLLGDGPERIEVLASLDDVIRRLGDGGASTRAAESVAAELAS